MIVVLLCPVSCSRPPEYANINSKGKSIVCFGDSLTYGFGVSPGQTYPDFLRSRVDIPVFNSGVDGDTSAQAVFRVYSDVLSKDPLLVIIEFGGNDFLRGSSVRGTYFNLESMVKQISEAGVIVALMELSTRDIIKGHSGMIRDLARKYKCILIPAILDRIIADPFLKSDFIHPNAKGYQLISELAYRRIKPVLEMNKKLRQG